MLQLRPEIVMLRLKHDSTLYNSGRRRVSGSESSLSHCFESERECEYRDLRIVVRQLCASYGLIGRCYSVCQRALFKVDSSLVAFRTDSSTNVAGGNRPSLHAMIKKSKLGPSII